MTSRKTTQIIRSLTKKGFTAFNKHHIFLRLVINGIDQHIFTKISHGKDEYGDNLLAAMAQKLRLTRNELDNFIDCTLEKEEYIQLLKNKGAL